VIASEVKKQHRKLLKTEYVGTGARKGFIEKPVKDRRGPATVMGSKSKSYH
jgi:hypothetical protein